MRFIKRITYFIYLLQLDEYRIRRFLRSAGTIRFFAVPKQRKAIHWTFPLIAVVALALLLLIFVSFRFATLLSLSAVFAVTLGVIVFLAGLYYFYSFLSLATLILRPLQFLRKVVMFARARKHLKRFEGLSVIGITGSYGKTTMKQVLTSALSEGLTVVSSSGNLNTPFGISRTILSRVNEMTDVLIVEMGAYEEGDIKELTELVHPEIVVLTGINEAHLDSFGSLETTVRTKFEIVRYSGEETRVVLNADDERVRKHYAKHTGNRDVLFYSNENHKLCNYRIRDERFHEDGSGISFSLSKEGGEDLGRFKSSFLADYFIGYAVASVIVGEILNIPFSKIKSGLLKARPAEHRLNPSKGSDDILVIDDSYNGNPDGAQTAINVLSRFQERRKIYVTPGLVEMGEREDSVHREIGERLSRAVDEVVLIKTPVTEYIREGLRRGGFDMSHLHEFKSMPEVQTKLRGILKPGDVVLFQNDWPDNYMAAGQKNNTKSNT